MVSPAGEDLPGFFVILDILEHLFYYTCAAREYPISCRSVLLLLAGYDHLKEWISIWKLLLLSCFPSSPIHMGAFVSLHFEERITKKTFPIPGEHPLPGPYCSSFVLWKTNTVGFLLSFFYIFMCCSSGRNELFLFCSSETNPFTPEMQEFPILVWVSVKYLLHALSLFPFWCKVRSC